MVPLADLVANPDNIREGTKPNPGLVANLRTDGVAGLLQPIIAVDTPEQRGFLVVDGNDRLASFAEAAKHRPDLTEVPVLLRADLGDHVAQTTTMLRTGKHRRELTSVEEARGIEQLALAGLSAPTIARRIGVKRNQVNDARAVAKLSTETAEKVSRRNLDLHQAAVVQEFADDEATVAGLLDAAERGPIAFDKKAAEIRAERQEAAEREARTAELTAAGVTVVDSDALYTRGSLIARLSALTHDGEQLTNDNHVGCPGAAIFFEKTYQGLREEGCCTDWQKYGHTNRYGPNRPTSGPMSDEQRAERQMVIATNKAMRAANDVRRAWIADLCKRPKVSGAARYVAETLVAHPYFLARWTQKDAPLLDAFLGVNGDSDSVVPPSANDARATVYALAAIAAAHEHEITHDTWRQTNGPAARWFVFLEMLGYDLAPVERMVVDHAATRPTEPPIEDGDSQPADRRAETSAETENQPAGPSEVASEESGGASA